MTTLLYRRNMSRWLTRKGNLFYLLILAFVLFKQVPVLKNNFSQQNTTIAPREVPVVNTGENKTIVYPPKGSRAITIFWASWCGPCKIEMSRLKESVASGAIPKDSLFAINPFETDKEIQEFIKVSDYPFTFLKAPQLAQELGISVTPTTLFIDEGKITKMSSGMSIWGIWEAELFL